METPKLIDLVSAKNFFRLIIAGCIGWTSITLLYLILMGVSRVQLESEGYLFIQEWECKK